MKKVKYYMYARVPGEGFKFREAHGYPFTVGGVDFFLGYNTKYHRWTVTEATTGLNVLFGRDNLETKEEAINYISNPTFVNAVKLSLKNAQNKRVADALALFKEGLENVN